MELSIIVIGDELLIGQVTDTNSGAFARMLQPYGWTVKEVIEVADDANAIQSAIEHAMSECSVVLTTGGLGPTKDDITKATLCNMFGGQIVYDASVMENIEMVFKKRSLELNRLTRTQAMVPDCCTVIQNRVGTAPIMWFEKEDRILVSMPGVPFEAINAMQTEIIPRIIKRYPSESYTEHRCVIATGLSESALAERLESWETNLPAYAHLAYLPTAGLIRLRLDVTSADKADAKTKASVLHQQLLQVVGNQYTLSDCDLSLPEILLRELKIRNMTIGTAESCTGGSIASRITSIAGASSNYMGSVVSYSNTIKSDVLGVSSDDISNYGAVSIPVVEQMALGARRILGVDCAISTSGIAGPGGGSAEKPVGTVCIAVATPSEIRSYTFHFAGDRARVIDQAVAKAMVSLIFLLRSDLK